MEPIVLLVLPTTLMPILLAFLLSTWKPEPKKGKLTRRGGLSEREGGAGRARAFSRRDLMADWTAAWTKVGE